MNIDYQDIELNSSKSKEHLTIALGNFSCFHLGHYELLKSVIKISETTDTLASVLCLSDANFSKNIMTLSDKQDFLKHVGIAKLININFDDAFKKISYLDFIYFLKDTLKVTNVVVGEDFRFGYNRIGSIEDLKKHFNVNVIKLKEINGEKISTQDVIKKIQNGDVDAANRLLGFNYTITGIVKKGKQNGHKINFPTINLSLADYITPKNGVYSAYLNYNNKKYLGMAYIGVHRTIDALEIPILELNVFDFDKDLYDETVKIELIDRISDDFKFSNIEELKIALAQYKSTISKRYSAK